MSDHAAMLRYILNDQRTTLLEDERFGIEQAADRIDELETALARVTPHLDWLLAHADLNWAPFKDSVLVHFELHQTYTIEPTEPT